jgi:hypothetical protein
MPTAQSHHDGLSVEVLAGAVAREEPRRGDQAAGGAQIGPVVKVVKEHSGEGFGHWDWFGAKGQPGLVWGHDDRGCGERGDADQGLGVEQQQCARAPVGQ